MRHLILILGLILPSLCFSQYQDLENFSTDYEIISYTELFERIANETDSVFRLSNTIISFDEKTDSLFQADLNVEGEMLLKSTRKDHLIVNKTLVFNNVQFKPAGTTVTSTGGRFSGLLGKIIFQKDVYIYNSLNVWIHESEFFGKATISRGGSSPLILNELSKYEGFEDYDVTPGYIFVQNKLHRSTTLRQILPDEEKEWGGQISAQYNEFILDKENEDQIPKLMFNSHNSMFIEVMDNTFSRPAQVSIIDLNNQIRTFTDNDFNESNVSFTFLKSRTDSDFDLSGNKFGGIVELDLDFLNPKIVIDFIQFEGKLISGSGFQSFLFEERLARSNGFIRDSLKIGYLKEGRFKNRNATDTEIALRGRMYNHFKSIFNIRQANAVYIDMKNIETARLKYEYEQEPHFNTFFKWKINQFLKLFSAYGTEPSRAVVFSVYVILAFALVYLFFPNYWDSHGKNRIMDRYRFFLKYVNKDSGMHEVYLDEKQPELLASEDFKHYLQEQGKTAPKFFMATALPLYRWSVAGTNTFSWMLSKVDVLKGKWSDTEDSKKGGKSFLLIGAFLIALLYDIFIKVLNALMLSINTFTTLGFGEIPIKGLPRYLAIIQGFIGWFMLTIFSVSLISQLLN